jgi:hypothetical protein
LEWDTMPLLTAIPTSTNPVIWFSSDSID